MGKDVDRVDNHPFAKGDYKLLAGSLRRVYAVDDDGSFDMLLSAIDRRVAPRRAGSH